MKKRIICLLLAVMMFAALPFAGALAAGEIDTITIGAQTVKQICEEKGLDYDFCKEAIIKLNGFADESAFTSLAYGATLKIPKTNNDAALYLNKPLPSGIAPKASADTEEYTVKNKDTLISICKDKGLDYAKCKDAILKLNGWTDYNLLTLHVGDKIKLPKTDLDAAVIDAQTTSTTAAGTGLGLLAPADGTVAAYMIPHVVQTGETIYGICQANGIDFNRYVNLIMQASGLKSATIYTGDVIFLPSATASSGSVSIVTHVVKGGETVYGICQALGLNYNASIAMITSLNPGKNLNSIHSGDVLFFPKGNVAAAAATGTGTAAAASGGAGYGGGYTPAASDPAVTQTTPKAVEGAMFYLTEYTVVKDDTIYNILKAKGMDMQYFNYYVSVMLAANNNRASFADLKEGETIKIAVPSGGTVKITGVKVKTGDTVIKMCETNKITYNENATLIARLNPNLNVNNLHVGDIVLLPLKP